MSASYRQSTGPGRDHSAGRLDGRHYRRAGLRTVSVIVPQARVLNGLQSLATGSYAFVGSAEAEMKATDSTNGQVLVAAVDERTGGMGIKSAASFQWGDAENAMDYWAEKINNRFLQLQGKSPAA